MLLSIISFVCLNLSFFSLFILYTDKETVPNMFRRIARRLNPLPMKKSMKYSQRTPTTPVTPPTLFVTRPTLLATRPTLLGTPPTLLGTPPTLSSVTLGWHNLGLSCDDDIVI